MSKRQQRKTVWTAALLLSGFCLGTGGAESPRPAPPGAKVAPNVAQYPVGVPVGGVVAVPSPLTGLEDSLMNADPLPSWKEGPLKKKIKAFVSRCSQPGGSGYVPLEARIAVFDNDGTLWPEKPVIEGLYVLERIKAKAAKDPSLKEKEPFKAALTGDTAYLKEAGEAAVAKLVEASHTGMTQEEFTLEARGFFTKAIYPNIGIALQDAAYLPMVELQTYLRSNGFKTWLCSGGTTDFMRVVSRPLYGIPPEQVIGTEVNLEYQTRNGRNVVMRKPGIVSLNDKAGKPVGISRQIGLRPIFAAGNVRSGGDIEMLTFSQDGPVPSLQLLINHDDGKREFAYQEPDSASLKAAKKNGWQVVSMKNDWKDIFKSDALAEARVGAQEQE